MKLRTRIAAGFLAAALLCPGPSARAAEPASTGTLSATVRMDYAQKLSVLRDREVRAELLEDGRVLGSAALTEEGTLDLGGYEAAVTLLNDDGGDLGGGSWPGYLCLSVRGLPQGEYALRFRGEGYCEYTQNVTLDTCSRHVILGTGDETFSLGDLNGDGAVDRRDRGLLDSALGSRDRKDLERFDLNGDGQIDVVDLAYVNRQMEAEGEALVLDTSLLAPPIDYAPIWMALNNSGLTVDGDLEELFRDSGSSVILTPAGDSLVVLPVPLVEITLLSQIKLVSPEGEGMPRQGVISVEDSAGVVTDYPFDTAPSEGVHAIGETPGSQVITISLGRRVPVKQITVTVTEAEGGGYVTLESIQFLQDIVPENPAAPNTQVQGLTAQEESGQVRLSWDELPNVSGYLVEYIPLEGGTSKSMTVDVTQALVTGLENLRTYLFTVTPIDGSWKGRPSESVAAVPQPVSAPAAPDMVSLTELDGTLNVSWKKSKDAVWYEVWYRPQGSGGYLSAGGRLAGTSTVLSGLSNGVTYEVYVTAGNSIGASGPSRISLGTPKAADYTRPAGIPAQGLLDSGKIQSIRLADSGNVDRSQYTADQPFRPENMIDGSFRTHWTANSSNFMRNEHVVCTFTQPVDLYSAIWVPRLDGTYARNLRAYSVRVWYQGERLDSEGHLLTKGVDNGGTSNAEVLTWPEIPNKASIPTSRFAILPFGPAEDVIQISIAVEQADYTVVSLSELIFLEYDPARCLPDNIDALFADGLRMTLKSGVTQAQIDALRQRLAGDERSYYLYPEALDDEVRLAEELLKAGRTSGVVLEGIQSRSSGADSAKYGQGGSDLQPLGAAARAGQEITIYAQGIPDGASVTVYASQYHAEASAWRASMGKLSNGRNVLTVPKIGSQNTPRGGSLYLAYSGANPENIRLHIRRAVDIPVLELSGWYELSDSARRAALGAYVDELDTYVKTVGSAGKETNCLNVTELSLPTVLLSLPALAVWSGAGRDRGERISTLYDDVLAWEDVLHICKTTQGIDGTYGKNGMTSRQNIRLMQMFSGAFMYAAGNHIGIGYGSCGGMVCGKPISKLGAGASANQLFGWGIAHEIGHNMDKLGRAEITNNLYALMVQTYDGRQNTLPSRLENSGKYPAIFAKTAQGLPGESNNVFVQLGMYWQLHLAYDSGDRPLEFYNRFFKAWKAGTYTQGFSKLTYDEKVALTASGTAGTDLTAFFTRWGMTLSQPVKDKLAAYSSKEERALWYLSDQSRRDRLAGKARGTGTVSLTAEPSKDHPDNGFDLRITCGLSQGSLQGFEIRRNQVPIAFLPASAVKNGAAVYTDIVGSANHRTYTYSVLAYDTLGNCIGENQAPERRIAYDKTVNPSLYRISRSGEAVTITLNKETAVSGWKILTPPAEGNYTVSVASEGGQPVLAGSFSAENMAANPGVGYFQKPGAEPEDTRIWTYDAKTVTITGIPASVPDESIQLISYAGDDVSLLEGGFAGLLSEEYRYGDGPGQVIEAGTLVIAGTYRGDPVYNTLRIQGRFTKTTGEGTELEAEVRDLNGEVLLLAEVPKDGAVSDISDGLFLFVPNVQREAELQEQSRCDGVNLLPSEIRAVLSRTDDPNSAASQHITAETMWTPAPGGADLPALVLKGDAS